MVVASAWTPRSKAVLALHNSDLNRVGKNAGGLIRDCPFLLREVCVSDLLLLGGGGSAAVGLGWGQVFDPLLYYPRPRGGLRSPCWRRLVPLLEPRRDPLPYCFSYKVLKPDAMDGNPDRECMVDMEFSCPSGRRLAKVEVKVAFTVLLCSHEAVLPQSPDVLMGNIRLNGPWVTSSCSGGNGLWRAGSVGSILGWCCEGPGFSR